jgi:hypothetical protein
MTCKMSKGAMWLVLVLTLGCCRAAKADSVTVSVDGTYSFASGGYGIPPYGGTLSVNSGAAQSEQFYCVDFTDEITGGMSWNVKVTSLAAASSSFGSTLLAQFWGYTASQAQTYYMAMAYLVTQMMGASGNQTLQAQYQYAIWSLTGGPQSSTSASLVQAALNYVSSGKFNASGWELLTPTSCSGSKGAPGCNGQEFLIYTPEPAAITLLLLGLLSMAIIFRRKIWLVSQS